jgi:hypothetical protein
MKVRDIKRRAKSKYVVMEGQKFLRECCAPRCRTYVAGCVTCDSWRFYDENGRFTRDWPELHTFIQKTEAEQERIDKHEAAHKAAFNAYADERVTKMIEFVEKRRIWNVTMCGTAPT